MNLPDYLKEDTWLSGILDKPSFNLQPQEFLKSQQSLESLNLPKHCFIQSKVDCDDLKTSTFLQKQGFLVIDTNVSYTLNINDHTNKLSGLKGYQIRDAQTHDKKQVMDCALNSFIYTRYHLDPQVDNQKADFIKSEWAGNYFNGKRGQHMTLAVDESDRVVGFCQILEPNPLTRIIDLIAVEEASRRQGLAQAMIRASITNQNSFVVGTQVSNSPSIRCYENLGFRHTKSQYVLHYHGL